MKHLETVNEVIADLNDLYNSDYDDFEDPSDLEYLLGSARCELLAQYQLAVVKEMKDVVLAWVKDWEDSRTEYTDEDAFKKLPSDVKNLSLMSECSGHFGGWLDSVLEKLDHFLKTLTRMYE